MGNRDLAIQAARFRTPRNFLDFEDAKQIAVMQVDVDTDAVPLREFENRIEMSCDIVVISGRIETADQIGAVVDRLIEQIDRVPEQRRSEELKTLDAELRAIHTSPPLSVATLPRNLTAPLSRRDPAQGSVVLIFPAVDLNQPSGMRAFTEVTRGLPDPAGQPTLDAIGESHLLYDILAYVTRDVRLMVIITLSGLVLVAPEMIQRFVIMLHRRAERLDRKRQDLFGKAKAATRGKRRIGQKCGRAWRAVDE